MKRAVAPLAALLAVLLAVAPAAEQSPAGGGLTTQQRATIVYEAMESTPVNVAAIRAALGDVGHVEAVYQSPPLKKWTDGARVIDGRIHLKKVVGLNRRAGGEAPAEWAKELTAPLAEGMRLVSLKLTLAPPPDAAAERDRLLARADKAIRAGLRELARKYPQLHITNWGTLEEALEGESPPGRVSLWVGRYSGGATGIKRPVPKSLTYNVFVLLRPLHWPVPAGQWQMHPMHSHLALMGQAYADAGDPNLRADLKKLVADALAPLERLNDRLAGRATSTAPATQPAGVSAERAKHLKANIRWFSVDLQYHGDQDKPFYNLRLIVLKAGPDAGPPSIVTEITEAQAGRIIDHLAAGGFLGRAADITGKKLTYPKGPAYTMKVGAGYRPFMYEDLGWGRPMLKRLDGLRKVLEGDAAKQMDLLLARLAGHRRQWQKQPGTQPTTRAANLPGWPLDALPKLARSRLNVSLCRARSKGHLEELEEGLAFTTQYFEVIESLSIPRVTGKVKVTYVVDPGQRPVRRGERVLWMLGPAGRGITALADTPPNRKAMLAALRATEANKDRLRGMLSILLPGSATPLDEAVAKGKIIFACKAGTWRGAASRAVGVLFNRQDFTVSVVLVGKAKLGTVTVGYTQFDWLEQRFAPGQAVIWIARPSGTRGNWIGVKALLDTPANRKTVVGVARAGRATVPPNGAKRPALPAAGRRAASRSALLCRLAPCQTGRATPQSPRRGNVS